MEVLEGEIGEGDKVVADFDAKREGRPVSFTMSHAKT